MSGGRRVLGLLCVTQVLLVLDVTIVGVALPALRADLGLEPEGLQWVVTAYVLAFGGLLLLAGRLSDVFGRRRLLVAGLALFAVGSIGCGLAASAAMLVGARAVQGTGAAMATPAALALLTTTFPDGAARTRALGAWTAAAPIGGASGLLLGGALTEWLGWRSIFLAGVPVALGALAAAPRWLPGDPARRAGAIDAGGAVIATVALVALVYALSRGAGALAALAVALAAGAAFVHRERRAPEPLVPPGDLRRPGLRRGVLVSLALTAATSPPLFFIALHLQGGLGWSPAATGLACLPLVPAVMAGAALAPRVIARHGTTAVMAGGLALVAAGAAVLTGISATGGLLRAIVPGELLYGAGLGAGSVAATAAGTAALPAQRQGLAAGLLNTAAQLGTAFGLASLVSVAALAGAPVDGYRAAFAVTAAAAAAAAALVAILRA